MRDISLFFLVPVVLAAALLSACGTDESPEPPAGATENVVTVGAAPWITEVAQSTSYGGSTADKVEVFCGALGGCKSVMICDTTTGGSTCSTIQAAPGSGQRVVVSRGSNITTTDQVWLADSAGVEIPGTRVGPFDCQSGASRARLDCASASFGACSTPGLGASTGICSGLAAPEDFVYSLQFTLNQHGGPEPGCLRPICQQLVGLINAAQTSIDFAVYGVRAQRHVIDALVAAQNRGVLVRGAVDSEDSTCTTFQYPDTDDLITALAPGSVACDVGSGYGYIMHNKFFVFDRKKVWTGSTNVSDTELGGEYNSDVVATIDSVRLAEIYSGEMDEMAAGFFHKAKGDNTRHILDAALFTDGTVLKSYFSPTDNARDNAVIPLINAATSTLDIAMFYLTSQEIGNAVLAAKARGVVVRVVIDAGGAANAYSMTPAFCSAGIPVKWENWGGKSHSKWAVADAAIPSQAAVVFGSMNWTNAGNSVNDENTLYVKNAAFAIEFQREFDREWTDLAGVPSCAAVNAEGADASTCGSPTDCTVFCASGSCCDGVDNDYDGHSDLTDEACACSDGIDNDDDGFVDANDRECNKLVLDSAIGGEQP